MRPKRTDMEQLIEDAQGIFRAGVRGVEPRALVGGVDFGRVPAGFRRVRVVGAGKAALAMAAAVEARLGDAVEGGLVVVPHGYPERLPPGLAPPARIEVATAGHPVPDAAGVDAARRTLRIAEACGEEDLLLVLVSGGGSALWPLFAEGISLEAARETFTLLLRSGAEIGAVNAVRKHLSLLGGGRLARAAAPAHVCALVLSDVVGDDLSVIASGPTVPDPTTFADALGVLERFDLLERVPEAVRRHLERGLRDPRLESPKPGGPAFARTRTLLVGGSRDALDAAAAEAARRGYRVHRAEEPLAGEAREAGRRLAGELLRRAGPEPVCLLAGGETVVTVRGDGRGGRNQEAALAAALALEGRPEPVVLLSGGTDGIDGPTDATGGWATPATAARARSGGLSPEEHLARNDAYAFLDAAGALLRTGPTHTNAMDLWVGVTGTVP